MTRTVAVFRLLLLLVLTLSMPHVGVATDSPRLSHKGHEEHMAASLPFTEIAGDHQMGGAGPQGALLECTAALCLSCCPLLPQTAVGTVSYSRPPYPLDFVDPIRGTQAPAPYRPPIATSIAA